MQHTRAFPSCGSELLPALVLKHLKGDLLVGGAVPAIQLEQEVGARCLPLCRLQQQQHT